MHAARRYALVAAAAMAGLLVVAGLFLWHEPAFLQGRSFPRADVPDADAERRAARMMTNASALHAAIGREGAWDAVFTDAEVNAWLAVDLPRNHASLLPAGVTAPRVLFCPRQVAVGVRLGYGMLSAVAWAELDVELRGSGQLRIVPARAGLGAIPLPVDFAVREIAAVIGPLGLASELRRIDGRLVLFVSLPATTDGRVCRLESLRIDDGELLLAGVTRSAGLSGRAAADGGK